MRNCRHFHIAIALLLSSGVSMLIGCDESRAVREDEPRTVTVANTAPQLLIHATHDHILVNESVLLFAETRNTLGNSPKLIWDTTLGKITPQSAGTFRGDKPSALFTSDKPGTAVITATLKLNDQTLSDTVNMTVDATK